MSLREFERSLSDMGDSSVLIGVTLIAALYFFICRDNREAIALLSSLALAAVIITFLKLVFLSCGNNFLHIKSPSGHAALSVAVYGIYPFLIAPRVGPRIKILTFLFFYALSVGIVYTRVSLHLHSLSEALLGFAIGIITVLIIKLSVIEGRFLPVRITPRFNVYVLLILTACIIAGMNGMTIPAEKTIQSTAAYIRSTGICR